MKRVIRKIHQQLSTKHLYVFIVAAATLPAAIFLIGNVHAQVVCPCHVLDGYTPSSPAVVSEGTPVTLGLRFKPQVDGYISGVRFYKDVSMTDTHTGGLWDTNGALLASGTYSGETASGWQDLTFTTPVHVTAGSLYTATLYTPTGKYISSANYFTSDVTNAALTAPRNPYDANGNSGNGVFNYGVETYPNGSFNQSNYWVDATFRQTIDGSSPQVSTTVPTNGATGIFTHTNLSATFDQVLESSTVSTATVKVTDHLGGDVPGTVSYSSASKTISFNPSAPLDENASYTVSVKGGPSGVANFDGTVMAADYQWSFTTGTDTCPCSIWSGAAPTGNPQTYVGSGGEVFGQTVHADENGYLKAVRFYKSIRSTDTTHSVHVWSTSGVLLGSGTSTHETSYGWQEVRLDAGVPVSQGQDYVISYYSNDNIYTYSSDVLSAQAGTGVLHANANGSSFKIGAGDVFPADTTPSDAKTSFWLDAVFTTSDSYTAPFTVAVAQPQNGAYGVKTDTPLTVKFTNPVDSSTVSGAVSLKTAGNTTVPGTASYDDTTFTVSFTPSSALAASTSYTLNLDATLQDVDGTHLGATSVGFTTGSVLSTDINQGLGGPVLVLTSTAYPYDSYLAEILRAEGINYFTVKDVSQLSSSLLNNYKLVLLGRTALSSGQVGTLTTWVQTGGNLIAMQPDKQLASLLGLSDRNQTLSEGYLKVDTTEAPGTGITAQTMQFHGAADVYGAQTGTRIVATLYEDATTPRTDPAVTETTVGSGHAAAFLYDLPKSIALTHQGNPAWAGQDRDGNSPIRPNDLFNGNGGTDWLNTAKAAIPQADEQQRLLTNMIETIGQSNTPLPRFWILPHGYKSALVMVEDDHGTADTTFDIFDQLLNNSATNCSVADWGCQRGGSLLYTSSGLTNAQAAKSHAAGFTMGVHVQTGCSNYLGLSDLSTAETDQIATFRAKYTSIPAQRFSRSHCYVWSDWDSTPKADIANGMRYNMNYEWYPSTWTGSYAGYLTGSGMNMRFTDSSGNLLDEYQGVTDLDYETDPTSATMDADLDNTLNGNEFYGVLGTHYDTSGSYEQQLIAAAKNRNIPMISADQMLTWKDALGSSTFSSVNSTASSLTFTAEVAQGGMGMQAMIPASSGNGALTSLKLDGVDVSYTSKQVKGVSYAVFDAQPGAYTALYGTTNPTVNTSSGSQSSTGTAKTKSSASKVAYATTAPEPTVAAITNQTPFVDAPDESHGSSAVPGSHPTVESDTPDTGEGTLPKSLLVGGSLGLLLFAAVGIWWFVASRRHDNRA